MDYVKEADRLMEEYAFSDCGQRGWCDTKKCPIWGNRKGRFDGMCVAQTYLEYDELVEEHECEIEYLQKEINELKGKIRKLKSFKKRFEEWLDGRVSTQGGE